MARLHAVIALSALAMLAPTAADVKGAPTGPLTEADERARLQALPTSRAPFKNASLASAIRLLAESAGMSYLAPPDAEFSDRITSDTAMNPFKFLEVLGENYGFGMDYNDGLWRFYRINLNELVTKAYTLRFNNLQQVTINTPTINTQLAAMGSMSSSAMGGPGSGPTGGGGKATFDTKTGKIIEDIKKILGLPTVGVATPTLDGSPAFPGMDASRKPLDAPKIEPIWNADTSQLFVVATRQQHSLIAAYLKAIDRPQRMIRIAVKFVETARNPQQALGVDWSQTFLGNGGPISLSGGSTTTTATNQSNAGSTSITVTNGNSSGGTGSTGGTTISASTSSLLPLGSAINLNHPGNIPLPTALLSAPAFQWTMQAISADVMSSIVQDPVIYTSNNREVSFKDTTQQPIQEGTTTIGSATAATTSQIAYIDVGTELTILPCVLPGAGAGKELVQLNLSINVSAITGEQSINGNSYPITTSRTYSYSVAIPTGETLAIAGLEQRSRQTNDSKVPVFGDIPVIGYAFKNRNDAVIHTTLLAFITPELIQAGDDSEGAATAAAPAAVPAPKLPPFRHRVFDGSDTETISQLNKSLEGIPGDIAALAACATAGNKDRVLNALERIEVELALMDIRLGELKLSGDRVMALASAHVENARQRLETARANVAKISLASL